MDLGKLGSRIKLQRERRRLRQADVATALRISSQAVSKWERGENAPDIAVLLSLSRLLGVSVEWLLSGNEVTPGTFVATVLCTSLSGYAVRATRMPEVELAAWANTLHYAVTEAVLRHDGVPIKCVGDGSLAFFSGPDQADRALAGAQQARKVTGCADLMIAIHSGPIFLGAMGHPDYARLDIIGATVNTAFLLMPFVATHCRGGIGLTREARELLSAASQAQKCGEAAVLGIDGMISVFEVGAEGAP